MSCVNRKIHEFDKRLDIETVLLGDDFVGREGDLFVEDGLLNWVESDIFFIHWKSFHERNYYKIEFKNESVPKLNVYKLSSLH